MSSARQRDLADHLLENVEDAVIGVDRDFHVTVWNRAAERMYGWSAEEAIGNHIRELSRLVLRGDPPGDLIDELVRNGRVRGEITVTRRDGSTTDVRLIAVAVCDSDGEPAGYLGIHHDGSERRQAEARWRRSQRQLATILESVTDAFFALDSDGRFTYLNGRAVRIAAQLAKRPLTRDLLLGRTLWETLPAVVGTSIEDEYRRSVRDQRATVFEYPCPRGGPVFEVHAHPSADGLSVYFRDITDRKRSDAERELRARQQALVAELGLRALTTDDLQPLMEEAVELVARTLDVKLVKVAERLPGGTEVLIRAGVGWKPGVVGTRTEPTQKRSQDGFTLASREPVVASDLTVEERFTASPVVQEHEARSGVAVLIPSSPEPFGILAALHTRPREYSGNDVNFMQAVANVLATAVQRAEGERRLHDVREAERRRIARDLHDDALQYLTRALIESERLRTDFPGSTAHAQLTDLLKQVSQQLRAAIHDLRPAEQDDRPFCQSLRALAAVQSQMAADWDVDVEIGEGTPDDHLGARGTEVLRIVQEALINARRHSGADRARVTTSGSTQLLRVDIRDTGRGFGATAPSPLPTGSGLTGMRERAAVLDAELQITGEPGGGTRVSVEVPLGGLPGPADDPVRVLLVDDHAAVREAIAAAFEQQAGFDVVGQAATLAEAREVLDGIDVAVIDMRLPDGSGADLIPELHERSPAAQALVLSAALEHSERARAVQRGAAAVLDKTAHLDEVVRSVRRLHAGEALLELDEVVELLRFAGEHRQRQDDDLRKLARLTPREIDVLHALAEGLDSKAIAERLHITVRTERNHVANILGKLEVHSQLQALVLCLRYRIVSIR